MNDSYDVTFAFEASVIFTLLLHVLRRVADFTNVFFLMSFDICMARLVFTYIAGM